MSSACQHKAQQQNIRPRNIGRGGADEQEGSSEVVLTGTLTSSTAT